MSRLHPLDLDFSTPSRLPRLWGSVVLGAGLLACTWVAFDYLAVTDELATLEQRRQSLERRNARQSAGLAATPGRDLGQVAEAARQLRRPWDLLLQELEGAVNDSVGLLSIEPDPLRQQLRITGEARQLDDAVAFAGRLEQATSLERPTVTGHQSRQSGSGPVIVFSIQAGWKENP